MNRQSRQSNFLIALALNKPVTVAMLFVALLVLGYISWHKIAVELLPQGFTPRFLAVFIPCRNSNPKAIEEQIVHPVEEYLGTVRKLRQIVSRSSAEYAQFDLEFDSDTNMKLAYSQVQDRVSRARASFPDDVEQEFIWKFSLDDTPILWLGIAAATSVKDPYYLLDRQVKDALLRLEGVARVQLFGNYNKFIRIDLDKEKVRRHGVDIYQLIQLLWQNNTSMFLGKVTQDEKRYFVRAVGHFRTLEELADFPVTSALKLRQLGKVHYEFEKEEFITRLNLNQAFYCAIYKDSTANTIATCAKVKDFLQKLSNQPKLAGLQFYPLWNQGQVIQESLDNLGETLLWGAFLALLVLLFFLRNLRMTLMITLSIPVSLLMTLIVMYFSDYSLNLLSMTGLTLGVGMLVDNTVVVVENIERLRHQGVAITQASLWGTGEVALAITLSTATTLVVFLPLMLMSDNAEFTFFMGKLGWPVCISLIASLLVALVFVPVTTARVKALYRRQPATIVNAEAVSKSDVTHPVLRLYRALLHWLLERRFAASLLFLLILASAYFPYSQLQFTDRPASSRRRLRIEIDFPRHFVLERSDQIMRQFEKLLYSRRKQLEIKHLLSRFRKEEGEIVLFLTPVREGRLTPSQIDAKIRKLLPTLAGVSYRMRQAESAGDSPKISLTLAGPDTETLYQIGTEVLARLRPIGELEDVEIDQQDQKEEIHIVFDREKAFSLGLTVPAITGTISYALRGFRLPDFKAPNREIPMTVQFSQESRTLQMSNMTIFSQKGVEVPLLAFSSISRTKAVRAIERRNRKTALRIVAIPKKKQGLKILRAKIHQAMAGMNMPRGYQWTFGKRFQQLQESNITFIFTFLLSVLFVFLLMGILFESFVLPFSILISIPFALLGVFWMLYVSDTAFQVMTAVGLVILAGIVVNNAIVLVDCINRLRQQGMSRSEAIITGALQRFRPILITALTTIVGLIPMAIGSSHVIGVPYYPLGRTVIGGLTASTLLTLLVVPLFYTFCDDLRQRLLALLATIYGSN